MLILNLSWLFVLTYKVTLIPWLNVLEVFLCLFCVFLPALMTAIFSRNFQATTDFRWMENPSYANADNKNDYSQWVPKKHTKILNIITNMHIYEQFNQIKTRGERIYRKKGDWVEIRPPAELLNRPCLLAFFILISHKRSSWHQLGLTWGNELNNTQTMCT